MSQSYFLNGEDTAASDVMSVSVNGGTAHPLAGFRQQTLDKAMCVPLQASPDSNAVGISGPNTIKVVTDNLSQTTTWHVDIDGSIITAGEDVQFIVFDNNLIARQGNQTNGFVINRVN